MNLGVCGMNWEDIRILCTPVLCYKCKKFYIDITYELYMGESSRSGNTVDESSDYLHLRSSHHAVTHIHNKNSNIQGISPNKELHLKERIRSLWEQILSFKRSSNFEKGIN